jgi:hypothetical protein
MEKAATQYEALSMKSGDLLEILKPRFEAFILVLNEWYTQTLPATLMDVSSFILLSPYVEDFIKPLTIVYVICENLGRLILSMVGLYYLNKFTFKSTKKETDVTNVNLFDRGIALLGLIMAAAEFSRFFPNEIFNYPFIYELQATYLTGIIVFLNSNQLLNVIWNLVVFRAIIRRRGPDTEWAGRPNEKIWLKYFIRYNWCIGFCLTALLEAYHFVKVKIFELLALPSWLDYTISNLAFYFSASILAYSVVCTIIGIQSKLPLFHGACLFHVGKPKKE